MTTADYALIISGLSFLVSAVSLGWNVWSKFVFPKPRVRVTASVQVVTGNGKSSDPFVSMIAINYGPGDVTLHLPIAIGPRDWKWRREHMLLLPLQLEAEGSLASRIPISDMPKKLAVGDSYSVYFPLPFPVMTKKRAAKLGFVDTFNRSHWVDRRSTKRLREMCQAAELALAEASSPTPSDTVSGTKRH